MAFAFKTFVPITLLAASIAAGRFTATQSPIVTHVTPRDQQERRYVYVPIDVPAGVTGLTIDYAYDVRDGANVIDLGVFEPGPLTTNSPARRGWSGGSKSRVTIGVSDATPGYWPGPIAAGRWNVELGLYKVAPEGVDVTVTAEFSRAPSSPSPPAVLARAKTALKRGPAWYAGVVHSHTLESDGALSVPQLIDKARSERLDFLIITDHNNLTHQRYPLDRPDLLVISGEEVTTPGGHFSVWGIGSARDFVDFRFSPSDPALTAAMEAAHARGSVIAINHPVSDCLACSWTHPIPAAVDAIEIANGTDAERRQAMTIWDTLLRSGRRVTAVEGRDWHRGVEPLGAPALRVWADELSEHAILDAIRSGRATVMADTSVPVPDLSIEGGGQTARIGDTMTIRRGQPMKTIVAMHNAEPGARVDWVWNGEVLESKPIAAQGPTIFDRSVTASGYGRLHVVGTNGRLLAVTNPIFVNVE